MHNKKLLILIRVFLGLLLLGIGLWLLLFFKREQLSVFSSYQVPQAIVSLFSPERAFRKVNLGNFLLENRLVIALISASVGLIITSGLSNYFRFILGLTLILAGLFVHNRFSPQKMIESSAFILSNYAGPGLGILGLITMLSFQKKRKRKS